MGITKEQWQAIDNQLSSPYGSCELLCDGYRLTLEVRGVSKLRYGIHAFVNGVWKGAWMNGGCEEAWRFMRPESRYVHDTKFRQDLIKIYGGTRCPKAKLEEINKRLTFYTPVWYSVAALRRHLTKNNVSIEVIRIGFSSDIKPVEDGVALSSATAPEEPATA